MLRRTLATAAVTAIAVVGLAPAASAQTNLNTIIDGVPCPGADFILENTFTINDDTTRSDLVKQVRNAAAPATGDDPAAFLATAQLAEQIGDKAVECKTVKPDPELFPGSSLPDVDNIQNLLQGLSSTLD